MPFEQAGRTVSRCLDFNQSIAYHIPIFQKAEDSTKKDVRRQNTSLRLFHFIEFEASPQSVHRAALAIVISKETGHQC